MLKTIHIENIAVIERADVEFSPGLNVLTGETGAGKSIVIDSLDAVLGGRVSRELVRSGAEKASVTAVFDAAVAQEWCRENEIDVEDDELILQRRISVEGKSSARCNGIPVTAAQLKELGSLLLDIHGQNDGRQLLDERRHLSYLDRFGVETAVIAEYAESYSAWRKLAKEAERLRMDESEKERLEESLRYRIQELEKARIQPGEEAELMSRRDLLRNSEKLTEQLDAAYSALYGGNENAVSFCADAEYACDRAGAWSADLAECAELIRNARFALEDAAERIREKQAEMDFSPDEYDRLEDRLAQLRRLEKKYSADETGLAEILEDSRKRLDDLEYAGDRLIKLDKEIAAAYTVAVKAAGALTKSREYAARILEQRVVEELKALSMPSVRFYVSVEPREEGRALDAVGADSVRFTMSANAGEAPGPISRIASGGELSRIMLALKNVFAEKDSVPSLVFDEIDTGVSGIAAQRVGEKLASLSRSKQVLCVTHLPQIAAMADEQYLVEKREKNGRTFTEIRTLNEEGRCRELARLQSGEVISDAVLSGAAELLRKAGEFRNTLI